MYLYMVIWHTLYVFQYPRLYYRIVRNSDRAQCNRYWEILLWITVFLGPPWWSKQKLDNWTEIWLLFRCLIWISKKKFWPVFLFCLQWVRWRTTKHWHFSFHFSIFLWNTFDIKVEVMNPRHFEICLISKPGVARFINQLHKFGKSNLVTFFWQRWRL